ncbi:HIT-like domain-containing protein [Rhodotorula diobovata]|uniref:HIT-like domain-containing protein n=1 Tax=Rhodotorula diobovata TaxID=5288 RepID=A0A5C5FVW9_9BASI|nr:HIT-like domain-containing protein [Rhodotorula diobovata]
MTSHLIDRFATRADEHAALASSSSPPLGTTSAGNLSQPSTSSTSRPGTPDPSCAFCAIVAGEEPAHLVYDDEHAVAFLDILPIRRGHLLLIPKRHYERIPHLPDDLSSHLGRVLPKLCRALCRATGQPDLNLVSNQGYAQVVPHAHFHLVPAPVLASSSSSSSSPSSSSPSSVAGAAGPTTSRRVRRLLGREELDDAEGETLVARIRDELRKEAEAEGNGGRAKL